ncbi:hypothetical protein F2Q69_00028861 [Brassica cretica]|uniref:Uncharacterized protein n=1 Tax=Brassica cretica TaxID=69181 RepID=A0A8S9S2W6_BRACR|nr:hypothetical protein F2Q69_00028861 [Brassica cretica]
MSSRRVSLRESERIRSQSGSVGAEDVSEALTEVLREETRLPRAPISREGNGLGGEKAVVRTISNSLNGSEGQDRPPKKVKVTGADHRPGVSGDSVVAKPFHWQFYHSKDCPITEDPDSVAHLVRHFKPAGCSLPSLQNMTKRDAYVKMVVAHAKVGLFILVISNPQSVFIRADSSYFRLWRLTNNEFAATLERRLQDVPRSDELYGIKKVVRELKLGLKMAQDLECANAAQLAAAEKIGNQAVLLKPRLRVVSNERKSALEQVYFLEAKIESSAGKFTDDLRRATYDAKKTLADSYLDVLISLKEKWEKKKAAADCEDHLKKVMANIDLLKEIMNYNLLALDELLHLRAKEISDDLPEEFVAKVPSEVNELGDEARHAAKQFEDGEFDAEE